MTENTNEPVLSDENKKALRAAEAEFYAKGRDFGNAEGWHQAQEEARAAQGALVESLAVAVEAEAQAMVDYGKRTGLAWTYGNQCKHAGYMEAADIIRRAARGEGEPR